MRHQPSAAPEFNADEFPLLRAFARGYLHQDLVPEYGSPIAAAEAYLRDLPPAERHAVAEETGRLRRALQRSTPTQLGHAMVQLGASWTFHSIDELDQLLQALERF